METDLGGGRELAPAKVNLTLHVTGRRPDGYHLLDSLVVFPRLGDVLSFEPSSRLSLTLGGPFGIDLAADADNLVLRAAELIAPGRGAALHLDKRLPVASGIGGGSSDAAAALRLLSRELDLALPPRDTALALGADVPVCLHPGAGRMRGIGEEIAPVPGLPPFWLVLVNPGQALPTPEVFRRLGPDALGRMEDPPGNPDFDGFVAWLGAQRNALEPAAISVLPRIATVLDAIAGTPACRLARMSGSGATCWGLYATEAEALTAAEALRAREPAWWVAAGPVD
ncbi:MAG: 4-(cytidine 5'-diphospho)-2-C-methyl-D-erythritol kinase [Rubricella sp.]